VRKKQKTRKNEKARSLVQIVSRILMRHPHLLLEGGRAMTYETKRILPKKMMM
jgi:hypothetical protein